MSSGVEQTAVGTSAEHLVASLLVQLAVILATTRVVVRLVQRLGQTEVSGEILAGLLLGPSLLGALAPDLLHRIFEPSTGPVFTGLAQLGLLLLMFQIGQEFEFGPLLGDSKRAVALVSLLGLVTPFGLGLATAPFFYARLDEPRPDATAFALFFAVAMSITAIPILGRIFMELGLSKTRTAALTIGAAAVDDVAGWLVLGVVSLVATGEFSAGWLALRLLLLAAYAALFFWLIAPLLRRWIGAHLERHGALQPHAIAVLLLVLFVSGRITSAIGVFAIFGGFVAGLALHRDRRFVDAWRGRVGGLVQALLLPLFFAHTGMRIDVGSLGSWREAALALAVFAVAVIGKFGGAYAAARMVGEPNRRALAIATAMNTRALMELVVLNVGLDLGVLPRSMFTKLVLMAIATTFIATPLIRWLLRDERSPELAPAA